MAVADFPGLRPGALCYRRLRRLIVYKPLLLLCDQPVRVREQFYPLRNPFAPLRETLSGLRERQYSF